MRELSEEAIRDIAYGSTVLGTGGGGDPYLGTLAAVDSARRYGPVRLIDADELSDDATVAFPFLIGSPVPFLEKLNVGPEMVAVHQGLEAFLGRSIDAVMSAEVGGANSTLPMSLGARLGCRSSMAISSAERSLKSNSASSLSMAFLLAQSSWATSRATSS